MIYLFKERNSYSTIMSYSYTTQNVFLACFGHYILNKKIILDYEDGLFTNRGIRHLYYLFLERIILSISSGCIMINAGLKKRIPDRIKTILINGVFMLPLQSPKESEASNNKKISILYSGSLYFRWGGLSYLFKLFSSPSAEKIDFHITGFGSDELRLVEFIKEKDLRNIFFHGYVSLESLKKIEHDTYGFIVCLNEDSPIYETNFPFKTFSYISSGKPVFLNRCSLFEEYESFENVFLIDNIEDGASVILNVYNNHRKYYPEIFQRMKEYNNNAFEKIKTIL
jgi:hypothetical protein